MYSRPGCRLCDEAREVLLAERERTPFAFEEMDIPATMRSSSSTAIRIPVVLVDGEELRVGVDPPSSRGGSVRRRLGRLSSCIEREGRLLHFTNATITSPVTERPIPEATVGRLPVYLRALVEIAESGATTVSSEALAEAPG